MNHKMVFFCRYKDFVLVKRMSVCKLHCSRDRDINLKKVAAYNI